MTSWLERGDPHDGKVHFNAISGALKKLLAKPKAELAAKGITAELRTFTIQNCEALQRYLKDSKKHHSALREQLQIRVHGQVPRAQLHSCVVSGKAPQDDIMSGEGGVVG